MRDSKSEHLAATVAWAPLAIRLALGIIFMAHGSQKLFGLFGGQGISGTIEMTASMGFAPAAFWGWALALSEFFGGLGIFFGFLTRTASVLILITMLVAVVKVHIHHGFFLSNKPIPGFEYNLALIGMAVALILSGAGKLSIDRLTRWKF